MVVTRQGKSTDGVTPKRKIGTEDEASGFPMDRVISNGVGCRVVYIRLQDVPDQLSPPSGWSESSKKRIVERWPELRKNIVSRLMPEDEVCDKELWHKKRQTPKYAAVSLKPMEKLAELPRLINFRWCRCIEED